MLTTGVKKMHLNECWLAGMWTIQQLSVDEMTHCKVHTWATNQTLRRYDSSRLIERDYRVGGQEQKFSNVEKKLHGLLYGAVERCTIKELSLLSCGSEWC